MPETRINNKFLAELFITILLGFALKYYPGPGSKLFNNSLAGIAYVIFWCLLFKLIFPHAVSFKIVISVTLITCLLEFAQLWHPPFLNYLRSLWLGKILLGTTFNISDFPYYILGGFTGWLLIKSP
ncbi:MAG: DUF2809 domain-containing protein [Candidatus Stygibacter frigidus]|nr:DUF2809 domain-containing protein [Candidatus Stygibacter frigidus]